MRRPEFKRNSERSTTDRYSCKRWIFRANMHAARPDWIYLAPIDTGQTIAASTVIDLFLSLRAVCVLERTAMLGRSAIRSTDHVALNNIVSASTGVKE